MKIREFNGDRVRPVCVGFNDYLAGQTRVIEVNTGEGGEMSFSECNDIQRVLADIVTELHCIKNAIPYYAGGLEKLRGIGDENEIQGYKV